LIYTIIVTGSVYGSENSISALLFCRALVMRNKHLIKSIFFYCDGVLHANKFVSLDKNNEDIKKKWIIFSLKNKVRLNVCFSAALRRGIISFKQSHDKINKNGNLDIFFRISSLEEFSRNIQKSDRIVQF